MDTRPFPPQNAMVFLASEDILSAGLLFVSQAVKTRMIIQFDFMPLASFLRCVVVVRGHARRQWQLYDEPRATLNFTRYRTRFRRPHWIGFLDRSRSVESSLCFFSPRQGPRGGRAALWKTAISLFYSPISQYDYRAQSQPYNVLSYFRNC